ALSELLRREFGLILARHFLCCRAPQAPPVSGVLTIRTGNLYNSVLQSLRISRDGRRLVITIGSNLPYARIHEFGGNFWRGPSYIHIPPRPYLQPTLEDLEQMMPSLLQKAIEQLDPMLLVDK